MVHNGATTIQSLVKRLATAMTTPTPHMLYWDNLSRNFEVEHIDMIIGHYMDIWLKMLLLVKHCLGDQFHAKIPPQKL